jgi:hypothetical protein
MKFCIRRCNSFVELFFISKSHERTIHRNYRFLKGFFRGAAVNEKSDLCFPSFTIGNIQQTIVAKTNDAAHACLPICHRVNKL